MAAHKTATLVAVVVVALAARAPSARACAACNCGDPTLTAAGIEQPYRNRVRAGIEERYMSRDQGAGLVGETTQLLRSTLFGLWTPHPRITISLVLPWITDWVTPATGPRQLINGLGDLELSGRVLLFRDRTFAAHHLLWALAGLKLPTGPRLRDDGGFPYADDDQPGSGSWDPFAGLTYAWFSGALWSAFANVGYRQTTKGFHDYRRGSVLIWNATAQAQPWTWGAFQLGLDGTWTQADTLGNGAAMPNTGGTVIRLAPAFVAAPRVDLTLRVALLIPTYQNWYGVQNEGVQVSFSLVYDIR
jgi:hypothetical protein